MVATFKTAHPKQSLIWTYVRKGDFIDGYATQSDLTLRQAMERAFAMPKWAAGLLTLRNALVRPFGLKTGDGQTDRDQVFPIKHEDQNEIVLGIDDTHLNFRISLFKQDKRIHMATWVHPNNVWGRAYLTIVMPFHIAIVRDSMNRIHKTPV